MSTIRTLGYVGFEASNLEDWAFYATNVVGLQIGNTLEDGTLVLRADEYERRLFIHPGKGDDIIYAGWELDSRESLLSFVHHLEQSGVSVTQATTETARARGVLEMYFFQDAEGVRQEIFFGAIVVNHAPFVSPVGQRQFITGDQGIGHIVLNCKNYEKQCEFVHDVLKFRVTDYSDVSIPSMDYYGHLTFLRCNSRHHSMALGNMPSSRTFNHIMLEVSSMEEVGLCYERAKKNGVPILLDLGQHTNDKTFSFYMLTPSGWAIEVGWGGIHIDDETWHVTHHQEPSSWGHAFSLPNPNSPK